MLHVEKKWCKIKAGLIPFSSKAAIWIRHIQVYRSLLHWHSGKIKNKANLWWATWRCGILDPFLLTIQDIKIWIQEYKTQCKYYKKHSCRFHYQHLNEYLDRAPDHHDIKAEQKILLIISNKKQWSFWGHLNYSLGRKKGRSVSSVQVKNVDKTVSEYDTKDQVLNVFFTEIHKNDST